ncbi:DNA repair enzyme Ada (O6-methylguanine-DNA--protein-cysteine methyltransferase) (AdaB) (PDB:6RLA) (PUBMED:29061663) [Commensalibacter communis]|uniref:Methylated-DNA--protein-cysteine methyltransferase n=1 Tax=Commensalibacter communis TaxID=2972786 RepID=A0A9W4TPP1_9PROT|nr:methylated-DNA--[protein]-cysteine S-methyltransferase [Commensalibacter communis]CAI3940146.1 DNA repair enzyme Ada (O6-methylguanine-DNA--protein-cysteine methyltransferase) (AdaB) (PDB:6RLA) (PUBMED:29061663) [Commensalibacter communis]CAI3940190.1 DNA repair enzyme Ada (O6-methylguanine-DNA--protein-cysteine methyltransferase) (AdaB) (PDB:6RLA) (PUBMED:29061663) [Commensalibacter communis]CAI3943284.1 DNA repair enzyme Ada (O6-methylguanine-DNA--protein-cysteine methyltransferase) (AdaB) 
MSQISFHSPVGELSIAEDDGFIVSVDWGWGSLQEETPLLIEAKKQFNAYFDGQLKQFELPVRPFGTNYQLKVWQALKDIPYGETCSYQELVKIVGGSPRSIGGANGANPIPLIIPCHRVIGKNGLGGYSGGEGIETKEYLLNMEQLFK